MASFDFGSIARFATIAKITRSIAAVNLRPPNTLPNAASNP
ncbi:MAG: hypothetical protein AB7W59_20275 [Acidimicrobiia bacterium]